MSQFIHEAGVTLITKYFIRRYNCRPFINPHDHNQFVVSFTKLDPFYSDRARNMSSVYFWVWVCFPYLQNLSQHNCLGLPECVFHRDGNPHNMLCFQGSQFTEKEVQEWVHGHGICWSHHPPYHPNQAASGSWNGLLRAQLKHQSLSSPLRRWGASSFIIPETSGWGCVCNRKYAWVQEQRSRSRVAPFTAKDPVEDWASLPCSPALLS